MMVFMSMEAQSHTGNVRIIAVRRRKMSANNVIYLNIKTFEVFYQPCADNEGYGNLEKKCKSLEEAAEFAKELCAENQVEYGIILI